MDTVRLSSKLTVEVSDKYTIFADNYEYIRCACCDGKIERPTACKCCGHIPIDTRLKARTYQWIGSKFAICEDCIDIRKAPYRVAK